MEEKEIKKKELAEKLHLIEIVKMYHGRGSDISAIADATQLSIEDVKRILDLISDSFDVNEELKSAVLSYDIMIKDLSLLIGKIENPDAIDGLSEKTKRQLRDQQPKLPEYFKQRRELVESKVKLLQSISKDTKDKKTKQVDLEGFELSKPQFKSDVFLYKVLSLLLEWGYTNAKIAHLKNSDMRTIREVVGCTKDELQSTLKTIQSGRLQTPTTEIERKLRKAWKHS